MTRNDQQAQKRQNKQTDSMEKVQRKPISLAPGFDDGAEEIGSSASKLSIVRDKEEPSSNNTKKKRSLLATRKEVSSRHNRSTATLQTQQTEEEGGSSTIEINVNNASTLTPGAVRMPGTASRATSTSSQQTSLGDTSSEEPIVAEIAPDLEQAIADAVLEDRRQRDRSMVSFPSAIKVIRNDEDVFAQEPKRKRKFLYLISFALTFGAVIVATSLIDVGSKADSTIMIEMGYCGEGEVRSGICLNEGECCSSHGWCGKTEQHCSLDPLKNTTGDFMLMFCGGGEVRNGVCEEEGFCCSIHGYCGTTEEHCGSEALNSTNTIPCGNGIVGNGICLTEGECCSRDGWCGNYEEHCATPSQHCGNGNVGNGVCEDGTCCSIHGWCGTTEEHCSSHDGYCGFGEIGNGICKDGTCCSSLGWCGTSEEHCRDSN